MVDITPEDIKMDKKLQLVDRGELEFQIGYYTEMTAQIMMHDESNFDVLLIKKHDQYSSLMYMVKMERKENEIKFIEMSAIRGEKDEESMMNITFAIDHALTIFNTMWGWVK